MNESRTLVTILAAALAGACSFADSAAVPPTGPTAIVSAPPVLPAAEPPAPFPQPPSAPPIAAPVPDLPTPPPACVGKPITRENWAWPRPSQAELQNTTCRAVTYTCALVDMADDRIYARHTVTVPAGTRGYFSLQATVCRGRRVQVDCHEGTQVEIRNPHFAAERSWDGDTDCGGPPPPVPPPPPVCGPDGRIPGSDKPCPKD